MRSRNYCFTINNYSTEDLEHLACNVSDICNYLICGFEVGEKGTPHIQGYCNLKNLCLLLHLRRSYQLLI